MLVSAAGRSRGTSPLGGVGVHRYARRGDLVLNRIRAREGAVGPAIPALGVLQVAFEDVDDAVKPGGEWRAFLLHDLVGGLPLAGFEESHGAGEWARRVGGRHSMSS